MPTRTAPRPKMKILPLCVIIRAKIILIRKEKYQIIIQHWLKEIRKMIVLIKISDTTKKKFMKKKSLLVVLEDLIFHPLTIVKHWLILQIRSRIENKESFWDLRELFSTAYRKASWMSAKKLASKKRTFKCIRFFCQNHWFWWLVHLYMVQYTA